MTRRLSGQTIVVTGATGIAAAGAHRFAAEGATVFIVSRTPASCEALAADINRQGGTASWGRADLTVEADAEAAFAACRDEYGAIDGLFAVAGGSGRRHGDGPIDEMSLEAWEETTNLNGKPTFLAVREATRSMQRAGSGSIVVVSSVLATDPSPRLFATHGYAAAKGAALSLVRSMAAYYAPQGVRVNGIAPSLIATPMSQRAATDPSTMEYIERKQPLAQGMLPPEAVADCALYLLSAEAEYVTGQVIAVDGGWSVSEA